MQPTIQQCVYNNKIGMLSREAGMKASPYSVFTIRCKSSSRADEDIDMDAIDCTTEEAVMYLKRIKCHSAPGPDGITAWMLSTLRLVPH